MWAIVVGGRDAKESLFLTNASRMASVAGFSYGRPKPKIWLMKRKRQKVELWLTATRWAKEIGKDPKTIVQRLRDAGVEVAKDSLYHLKTVLNAVYGDEQAEKVRGMKLDNEERERKAREADGVLVDRQQMEKEIAEFYVLPWKHWLESLPGNLASMVNPNDPELAREALQRAVEDGKRLLREKLPKRKER